MLDPNVQDVIIVGSGIAGMAAALDLARRGVSFTVVDSAPRFGGTARGGGIGSSIAGSPEQQARGISDNWELAVRDLQAEGNDPDVPWARFYYRRSVKDVFGWFINLGISFDKVNLHEGDSAARWHLPLGGGVAVMDAVWAQFDALGLQSRWRLGVTVRDLLQDGERVVGVEVEDADGRVAQLRAQSVLLATGGFGGNLDMGREASPRFARAKRLLAGGNPNSQGQLHKIVAAHGGRLAKMEDVYAYATGTPDYRDGSGRRGVAVRGIKTGIWVNAAGQRFHNEDLYITGRSAIDHLLAQPDQTGWAIFDDSALSEVDVVDHYIEPNSEGPAQRLERFLANSPYFTQADTLAQLAAQVGIAPEGLADTVRSWNQLLASGAAMDPLTGRQLAGLRPLGSQRPWRAIQFFPLLRKTLGGVATDRRCRVLDAHSQPIAGLFAAGELAGMGGGGLAGARPLEGLMAGGSLFSGLIAARWIARGLDTAR